MNKPVPVEEGVTFDLHAIAQELRSDESYRREGQAARTLVRTPDLRIVVVVLQAGKTISEHHVDVTAAVQTLSGRVRLQLPDESPLSPRAKFSSWVQAFRTRQSPKSTAFFF